MDATRSSQYRAPSGASHDDAADTIGSLVHDATMSDSEIRDQMVTLINRPTAGVSMQVSLRG